MVEVNGGSSPDDVQTEAGWRLRVIPGKDTARCLGQKAAGSGTSPGASVGGALRSTLAGELRRNCHFLRLGASQKRKVGRDTSVPFFNRFVNWPLKGLRRI